MTAALDEDMWLTWDDLELEVPGISAEFDAVVTVDPERVGLMFKLRRLSRHLGDVNGFVAVSPKCYGVSGYDARPTSCLCVFYRSDRPAGERWSR